MPTDSRSTIVYDVDCGPCTSFKRGIGFLDRRRAIDFVPLAEAERSGMLDRIQPSLRWASFHLITADGSVESGAEALPDVVSVLPAGSVASRLILSAPGGTRATAWVYSVLSRLHNSSVCGNSR